MRNSTKELVARRAKAKQNATKNKAVQSRSRADVVKMKRKIGKLYKHVRSLENELAEVSSLVFNGRW